MGFVVYNPYLTAAIATIGGMLFGFDISSVSSFVGQEHYRSYFNYPDSITQGGITASMAGGSFLGSLIVGYFSDRFGRKICIQVASVFWMIGCAVQCSAQNQGQLIAGRVIAGFGIGLASSTVPVLIAELSPKNIRGRLVGVFQWAITWGIMIMFYVGYGCSFINGPNSFRVAWGIMIIPGFLLFLGVFILPESPRWLASKDRWEEAIHIIANVQAKGDVDNEMVTIEINEIREAVEIERQNADMKIWHLFKKDSINRTMVGLWGQIWQQLTGMNVMMYYITMMFEMAGYHGNSNLVSSSIQYVINVIMTVPALLFLDRWGRRMVLISGSIIMMAWLFATAGILASYGRHVDSVDGNELIKITVDNKSASKALIACSYLFVATFAPTWGPTIWVYCSEIFPTPQRALANGLCASANWAFNFALAMFVPTAFQNITWKTYIIFAVFCIAMTIHVFLLFPETKGKTLEEINYMWDAKIPAWRTANWVPPTSAFDQGGEEKDQQTHIEIHTDAEKEDA
ncbi:uncharacterized protein SAPINGB_P005146 [Magnusiomyces paraingens]|uniref:Major facilitator superfamily (MFS) profile domain-containing protein n=1 Tax=Magnusiomyces paraingens TaxID=2606893 RepID=A0A5E8C0V2_9ASCO|nr:uncharacterized protein SAPINGB_P005146 [Saprochaete ingens]VVT56550.1 unnamed protein product [Saprochaete ingens]